MDRIVRVDHQWSGPPNGAPPRETDMPFTLSRGGHEPPTTVARAVQLAARMSYLRTLVVFVALLSGCASGADDPAPSTLCSDARAHIADVRVNAGPVPDADRDAHRSAMVTSLGDGYLDRCRDRGDRYARCVLSAAESQAIRACDEVSR